MSKIKIEAVQDTSVGLFLTHVFFGRTMTHKVSGATISFKELVGLVDKHSLRAYEGGYHFLYLEDAKEDLLAWCELVKETTPHDFQVVEKAILEGKTKVTIQKDDQKIENTHPLLDQAS